MVTERTHNMVNRHTGAVAKGALFSLEALPPQSKTVLSFTLKDRAGEDEQYQIFIKELATNLKSEILDGGSSKRGIGRMVVDESSH
jgi:CRISPR/Cas system CMR subunit Cmr4 (Cas7 group RAMP superfamily)